MNIPLIFISYDDGIKLKEIITTHSHKVTVSVTFPAPYQKDVPKIDFWFLALEKDTYIFLDNLKHFWAKKGEEKIVEFVPHLGIIN